MSKKKNILITGGSGYIGRNLQEHLKNKYIVYAPSRKQLDLLDAKATNKYFRAHQIDVVIHTAVVGGTRKSKHIQDSIYQNLRMFINTINNKDYFKKMINLGSGAEYDKVKPIINVKESDFDKKIPIDDYGFYKYVCSKYIENSDKVINLRIFGLFGKYENYGIRFISNAICRSLLKLPITINKNVFFDYVSIEDFSKLIEYFIENPSKEKFYNIGRGQKIDLITIAKKINKIAPNKVKIIVKKRGLDNEYTCNNSRLIKELKNFQFEKFDVSLVRLYNWYMKTLNTLNKNKILQEE